MTYSQTALRELCTSLMVVIKIISRNGSLGAQRVFLRKIIETNVLLEKFELIRFYFFFFVKRVYLKILNKKRLSIAIFLTLSKGGPEK